MMICKSDEKLVFTFCHISTFPLRSDLPPSRPQSISSSADTPLKWRVYWYACCYIKDNMKRETQVFRVVVR